MSTKNYIIDPCSGVGFSYSEVPIDFVHNDQTTTSHKWATIANWIESSNFSLIIFTFQSAISHQVLWLLPRVCQQSILGGWIGMSYNNKPTRIESVYISSIHFCIYTVIIILYLFSGHPPLYVDVLCCMSLGCRPILGSGKLSSAMSSNSLHHCLFFGSSWSSMTPKLEKVYSWCSRIHNDMAGPLLLHSIWPLLQGLLRHPSTGWSDGSALSMQMN